MAMKGGVGAGGGGGDEPWARAGGVNGNGKAPAREPSFRERENNRNRERCRRATSRRMFDGLRQYGNYTGDNNNVLMAVCNEAGWTVEPDGTTYRKGQKPPAGDQEMVDVGGSASVNPSGGDSYGLTRTSPSSGITLGGGADHIPAWLKDLSKQLSDNSYPNFFESSSKSKARATPEDDGSPDSSPPRLRKKARYSTPTPPTPPSSPERASAKSNELPPPWARGAGAGRFSFQTSGPDPVTMLAQFQISNAAAATNKAPAFVASGASLLAAGSSASASAWVLPPRPGRSSSGAAAAFRGRGAALINPLGFSFRGSGGVVEEEEVVLTEEEGLELTLGNAESRKA